MAAKKKATKSVAKKEEQTLPAKASLLEVINEIDAQTIAKGTPKAGELWVLGQRGQWLKGRAVAEYYPEVEEYFNSDGNQPGRKVGDEGFSFRKLSEELKRSDRSVRRWIKLFFSIGKSEKKFLEYAKEGREAQEQLYQQKQVASDAERGEPKPDKKKRMENSAYNMVKRRYEGGEELNVEDLDYVFGQIDAFRKVLRDVLGALVDDDSKKAMKIIEKSLSGEELDVEEVPPAEFEEVDDKTYVADEAEVTEPIPPDDDEHEEGESDLPPGIE